MVMYAHLGFETHGLHTSHHTLYCEAPTIVVRPEWQALMDPQRTMGLEHQQ